MFKKILVANRGEIAVRVIRACREMGVSPVTVYSDADRTSLSVRMADEAISLGDPVAARSYLDIDKIIGAAKSSGCEAIHPGYGFLSENPLLAERCEREGNAFIGPTSETLRLAGDKVAARRAMKKARVPVIPGSDSPLDSLKRLEKAARKIGFPIMLKAAGGGGGKGIRSVEKAEEIESAFRLASSEAEKAFGDPRLYVEKRISGARHVEVQVLADGNGKVLHLGERECSIQRRHQKLIEETPCAFLPKDVRRRMLSAAVRGAKAIGYRNAGTIEFLVAPDHSFFFLEVNARLQVEHPVTEAVTGVDLVREQIRLAAGDPLSFEQREIKHKGWAIEGRIYAEDPDRNFSPSPGKVGTCSLPGGPGVRVDSGAVAGTEVSLHYDALLAKVTTWGADRAEAIRRLRSALGELLISGVTTTAPLIREVLGQAWFRDGRFDTASLERYISGPRSAANDTGGAALAAAILQHQDGRPVREERHAQSPWVFWGRLHQLQRWPHR